jgi:hypothetical protein
MFFRYAVDNRLIAFWGVYGCPPGDRRCHDHQRWSGLRATFGFLNVETALDNVAGAHITRNYRGDSGGGSHLVSRTTASRSGTKRGNAVV